MEEGLEDRLEFIEAFAEPGTDRFEIQVQLFTDVLVAEVGKVAELDNVPAGTAEVVEGVTQLEHVLLREEAGVGSGTGAGEVGAEAGLGVGGIE